MSENPPEQQTVKPIDFEGLPPREAWDEFSARAASGITTDELYALEDQADALIDRDLPKAQELFTAAQQHPDKRVRQSAASSVGILIGVSPEIGLPLTVDFLADPDAGVRQAAHAAVLGTESFELQPVIDSRVVEAMLIKMAEIFSAQESRRSHQSEE